MNNAFKNPRFDEQQKSRIHKALHGLVDEDVVWSLHHEKVHELVTDDGRSPRLTFTEIGDVGRFVAAACDLHDGQWKHDMSMVGDTVVLSDLTDLIEKTTGIKLQRERIDRREAQRRIDGVEGVGKTEEEILAKLWAQFELEFIENTVGAAILEPVVNKMCPQVKPLSMKEYLECVFKVA